VRGGRNNGNRAFYPTHAKAEETPEVLGAFIAQFYDDKPPPPLLLVNHELPEQDLIAEALSLKADRKVEIALPQRGEKRAVVLHAETNAREALERKLAESAGQAKLLEGVAQLFNLPGTPERIEVYDNSHIMGTNPYGVMIVAGPEGFMKNAYRKFSIRGPITPGDDFAMMREMLQRRFSRALKEQAEGAPTTEWPDLLLIDGGAGQLSATRDVLADLGVQDVKVVASGCIRTDRSRFSYRRATRYCTSCSVCAMRRTASRSPHTGRGGRRTSGSANSTKSRASDPLGNAPCSIISAQAAA
jgi:excinuclease ABC subunit C